MVFQQPARSVTPPRRRFGTLSAGLWVSCMCSNKVVGAPISILVGLCVSAGAGLWLSPVASAQPLFDPSSLRAKVRFARGSLLTDVLASRVEKTLHPLKRSKRYPPDWATLLIQNVHDLPAALRLDVVPDRPLSRPSFLYVSRPLVRGPPSAHRPTGRTSSSARTYEHASRVRGYLSTYG